MTDAERVLLTARQLASVFNLDVQGVATVLAMCFDSQTHTLFYIFPDGSRLSIQGLSVEIPRPLPRADSDD